MRLRGSRLIIRSMSRTDLPRLVQWKNDREIADLVRGAAIFTSLSAETRRYEKNLETGEAFRLVICNQRSEPIGFMVVSGIDKPNHKANLGMLIGEKAYWGQGFGKEALKLVLNYFFYQLGFNRIGLEVFDYNVRAIHLYKAVGFREEGVQRQGLWKGDHYCDIILMGITKEDYHKFAAEKNQSGSLL